MSKKNKIKGLKEELAALERVQKEKGAPPRFRKKEFSWMSKGKLPVGK
jgi:hypothetical protein